jgi:hypothetical protein
MAIDNRDWYISTQRKRQGYVERAAFRVNLGEVERQARRRRAVLGWLRLLAGFAAFVLLLAVAAAFLRGAIR